MESKQPFMLAEWLYIVIVNILIINTVLWLAAVMNYRLVTYFLNNCVAEKLLHFGSEN
jgi:hypothetical protein